MDMENCERKRPVHLPNVVRRNTPTIVFVTVCAANRAVNTFATDAMHELVRNAWTSAGSHIVGAYMLMPDHVHLFCAPASLEAENVAGWVRYWKSLVMRDVRGRPAGGARVCAPGCADGQTPVPPVLRPDLRCGEGRADARQPSLFQRDCWDTQLRRGESYHDKWEYVRNNPVRRGLAASPEAWPYGGVMHELIW